MKRIFGLWFLLMAIIPVASRAEVSSFEVKTPIDHIFVPFGFDSNDKTEVLITGFLPSLCYKHRRTVISVKGNKVSITVVATINHDEMKACAQVTIPFVEQVSLGVLNSGKYQIVVNENSEYEMTKYLDVSKANRIQVDEEIYASVDQVRVDNNSRKVHLTGYTPSDCLQLKEIKILDNGSDTYSILPIMEQVRAFCPRKMVPFNYKFLVPEKLKADRILLHVRVIDGGSVNAFFLNKIND